MKRCPQCGAEYDDFVQYCFVDGAELVEAAAAAPPPPPPAAKRATPVPAAAALPPPKPAAAPPPTVQRPAQDSGRGLSIWALVILFMAVIALFGFSGVVGALFLIGGQGSTAQPAVEAPRPAPIPPPHPQDGATEVNAVSKVRFESLPPGASVWEGDQLRCDATPCDVDQPDFAPPQRTFVLKLPGYPDTQHVMSDPSAIQAVTFPRSGTRPRPVRPPDGRTNDIINVR